MDKRKEISKLIKIYLLKNRLSQTQLAKSLGYRVHGQLNQVVLCNADCSRSMASALYKLDPDHFTKEILLNVF